MIAFIESSEDGALTKMNNYEYCISHPGIMHLTSLPRYPNTGHIAVSTHQVDWRWRTYLEGFKPFGGCHCERMTDEHSERLPTEMSAQTWSRELIQIKPSPSTGLME